MIRALVRNELLLGSRRNRLHAFRWVYASWLIFQIFYLYLCYAVDVGRQRRQDLPAFNGLSAPYVVGEWFAKAFVSEQTLLLILATPILVAGAIADEKTTGTMQYLLTTQLDTRHIVLGKMIGRAAQVLLLCLVGLPLFGLMAGFGGVGPLAVLLSFVAIAVPLLGVAAVSMLASTLCRQTRDAALVVYVAGLFVWLGFYLANVVSVSDPFRVLHILEPVWGQRGSEGVAESLRRLGLTTVWWSCLGIISLSLAMMRLRPVYRKQLEGSAPTGVRWYQAERPVVEDNPVRWRERFVSGLAPNAALRRIPQWLAVSAVGLTTIVSSLLILYKSLPSGVGISALLRAALRFNLIRVKAMLPGAEVGFLVQSIVVLLLASMIVGIRCSWAVTGERERKSWEALLLTPLGEGEIVMGKFWGVLTSSYWYLLAYAAPALALSALGGLQAVFYTVLWLAITVLAMFYLGAAGLYCSVRSSTSWRGLLSTLGLAYLGGAILFAVTSPVPFLVAYLLQAILTLVDQVLNTQMAAMTVGGGSSYWSYFIVSGGLALALIFYLMSRYFFLAKAQSWIAVRERTRHWQDEPYYRRSRRPRGERPVGERRDLR